MPTFAAGYAVLRRRAPRIPRPVGFLAWTLGVAAFALLDLAVTVGASYSRLSTAQAHWPAVRDALTDWDLAVATLTDRREQFASFTWGITAPALDLDVGAALGQVAAQTVMFAVLLSASVVIAVHGRRTLALASVLAPAVSVAALSGVLALVTPPLLATAPSLPLSDFDSWPATLQPVVARLDEAITTSVLPVWWRVVLAALVASIALVVVLVVLHRSARLEAPEHRPSPVLPGLAVAVLLTSAVTMEPTDGWPIADGIVLTTFLVVLVLAAAGSLLRGFSAVLLTAGVLLAQLAAGRAPDGSWAWSAGWNEGPFADRPTAWSAVALVAAPVLGWLVAVAWAALPIHDTQPVTHSAQPS